MNETVPSELGDLHFLEKKFFSLSSILLPFKCQKNRRSTSPNQEKSKNRSQKVVNTETQLRAKFGKKSSELP